MVKVKSIQSKIIFVVIAFSVFIATALTTISVAALNLLNRRDSNLLLEHLGRESAINIDKMLTDTEHSVRNIYYYAYDQLEQLFGKLFSASFREDYMQKVSQLAISEAKNNDYIRVFYYRLTDAIKDEPKGFAFEKSADNKSFAPIPLIDFSLYSKDDIARVGWYYLPQEAKEGVWIGPYMNTNINIRMISYVEPVYVYGRFAGVIGMDIDIDVLCEELQEITVYNTGSAIMFDIEDNILYEREHASGLEKESFGTEEKAILKATHESLTSSHPVKYKVGSKTLKLYAVKLSNGMTLCINAPLSEINASRQNLLMFAICISFIISIVAIIIIDILIKSFLKPLHELTEASKSLSEGNFDVNLSYSKDDEIGCLSNTFSTMSASLKRYYDHFHNLAYTDAMTGLNNKAAFETAKDVIQSELKMKKAAFTIIVMDVNNLKTINDSIGHEKGDLLLKHVASCMRDTFVGFPLYRIGGDEFCTIINNADPQYLISKLQSVTAQKSEEDFATFRCSYQIAAGAAVFEKDKDKDFDSVFNRADKAMYENKRLLKERAKAN